MCLSRVPGRFRCWRVSNLIVSGQVQSDYVHVTYRDESASLMFFREGAMEAWSAARQIARTLFIEYEIRRPDCVRQLVTIPG